MIKIGVIGVGGMGSAHCGALKEVENTEFVGVWDLSEEAAANAAERFEAKSFSTCTELLDNIEAVVVATPGFHHVEPVVNAARVGVHVFVEKPFAATVDDCDTMLAACQESSIIVQVGMVLRFYPTHQLGMQMLQAGEIGDLVYIETDYSSGYNAPRQRPQTWYGKMGGLLENGIHKVDLINWYGGKVKTVAAEVGTFSGHDNWEDYATALIRYESGVHGILRWGSFLGARGSTDTFLDGSKGSLWLCIGTQTVFKKLKGESDWAEIIPDNHRRNNVVAELQHFVNCIRDGDQPIVDGKDGRASTEMAMAIYRSAREGEKINL